MRRRSVAIGVLLGAVALGFGACRLLLPEGYVVNVPLRSVLGWGVAPPEAEAFGERIRAPEGFSIGLYGEVPGARMLLATPAGDLLVSAPGEGRVAILRRDANEDGRPDAVATLLEDLDRPHGLALHQGELFVAEASAVARVPFDVARGAVTGPPERVVTGLPEGGNHWTRTIGIGPEGWLYVTVGSSCNACLEEDPRRAAMLRYRRDGSGGTVFATGLRNAVGFAWRPADGALFATDNGRDFLGDDRPPCELNRVVEGGFYGWPFANGFREPDPDFGPGNEAVVERSLPPVHGFAPHNAPLGITFLRGETLPDRYRGAALVALHGSWNRSEKDGYEVVSLHWEEGGIREEPFVWGFLRDGDVIGRPVDVAEGPSGAIYVSDDYAGAVYRVSRGGPASPTTRRAARETAPAKPLADLSPERVAEARRAGRALYERHECARCHDAERAAAEGATHVPLEALATRYGVKELASYLEAPQPPMPAVPLSAEERRELAVFLLAREARPGPGTTAAP